MQFGKEIDAEQISQFAQYIGVQVVGNSRGVDGLVRSIGGVWYRFTGIKLAKTCTQVSMVMPNYERTDTRSTQTKPIMYGPRAWPALFVFFQ